jgi:hypothetical protein
MVHYCFKCGKRLWECHIERHYLAHYRKGEVTEEELEAWSRKKMHIPQPSTWRKYGFEPFATTNQLKD